MSDGDESAGWFGPDQQQGLQDFWRIYDQHYASILADTLRVAREHPEFAPIVAAMSSEQIETQNREGHERLRRAVGGAWAAYEAELRQQGSAYANLGISFTGWYDLVGAFKQDMVLLLIAELGGDLEWLAGALRVLHCFVDRTMRIIGE